ncbi:MAG TPA: hypothetical protein P5318_01270 [Candidatus Hydrogenedentes bacterium]|nr:hypothetical protein [Candidatus Hydrogenedentota bacterium]HPC14868.1 hypothetical protein [Candidatus Hydrogenedentota bacterium]HRT18732.1 hypothetical protein [Candidatus Hydrogenedentota bacterium]HRT63752.1 hypothetical protein [Candidatus Hydrogenedentota bacterium]
MTSNAANFLALIYAPLMWAMVAITGVLGFIGVFAPGRLRASIRLFTRKRWARLLGVLLMIIGAEMFLRAPATALPLLVKSLGVFLFVDGGVRLVIPTVNIIIAEWCIAHGDHWHRVLGMACFVFTFLFYHATRLPLPIAT